MCEHFNIVVAHNNIPKQCIIRCSDCDNIIYQSKNGIEESYKYLENNKHLFKTLYDLTCDDLNEKFKITCK